jgi:hypothetical protein
MIKRTGVIFLTLLLTSPASIAGDRVATTLEDGLLFRLVEPEEIHRMEQPGFVSLALAQGFMGEFEPVLGVTDGEHAKAYSAWLMEGYSVINDKIGDRPIVVTWSPFSFSGKVWDRVVDGVQLEFEDSGELWNDALVLVDKQTGSRWSHLEGRALDGPHKGQQMAPVLNTYTSWGKWRSLNPATLALTKLGRDMEGSDFRRYYERTTQLGPANSKNPDSRLAGKELVCGFHVNGTPVAVPLYALVEHKQFKLDVNGVLLEVEFDHLAETAIVYSRQLEGEPVELVRLDFGKGESYLKEKATGTTWLTYSGRGVSGPRSNLVLEQIPSTLCFWFVWVQHYPLTLIWETPGSESMP